MPAPAEPRRRRCRRLWGELGILLVLGLNAGRGAVAPLGSLVAGLGWPPGKGFRFATRLGEDRALMGVTVSFKPGQVALIGVPPVGDAMVRLLRDGAALHEAPGGMLRRVPLPGRGVYRVEADLRVDLSPIGGMAYGPWIFSNPGYRRG